MQTKSERRLSHTHEVITDIVQMFESGLYLWVTLTMHQLLMLFLLSDVRIVNGSTWALVVRLQNLAISKKAGYCRMRTIFAAMEKGKEKENG